MTCRYSAVLRLKAKYNKSANSACDGSHDNKPFQVRAWIYPSISVITIEQFNFAIQGNDGATLTGRLKSKIRIPCTTSAYLSTCDSSLIPSGIANETGFQLSFHKNNRVRIKALQGALPEGQISPGGHTILSSSFRYQDKDSCAMECATGSSIPWQLQLELLDQYGLSYIPNQLMSCELTFSPLADQVYRLAIPSLSFTSTTTPSPENLLESSAGNLGSTYTNNLPSHLREQQQNRSYQVQGTYNDGTNPLQTVYARLTLNIFGQLMLYSNPSYWFMPGTYTFAATEIIYDRGEENRSAELSPPVHLLDPEFSDQSNWDADGVDFGLGYRDTSVNDSYNDLATWAYISNHGMQSTPGFNNMFFVRAKLDAKGNIVKQMAPVQITSNNDAPATYIAAQIFDVSTAISRKDQRIVLVSYTLLLLLPDYSSQFTLYYQRSTNGGKSFGIPLVLYNSNAITSLGDARGFLADPHGNFWLSYSLGPTNSTPFGTNATVWISTDEGQSFQQRYATTQASADAYTYFDYPQIAVTGMGHNSHDGHNQGLWMVSDYLNYSGTGSEVVQALVFVPLHGKDSAHGQLTFLTEQADLMNLGQLAVSNEGQVFIMGPIVTNPDVSSIGLIVVDIKSDKECRTSHSSHTFHTIHASPVITVFDYCYIAAVAQAPYPFPVTFPTSNDPLDDFNTSVQSLWYDTARRLLYAILNLRMNRNTQDFYQFMICSATNGRTWSQAIFIPEITSGNRGWLSSAYNTTSKSLTLGWYDAMNSITGTGFQYLGASLNSEALDHIQSLVAIDKCK